MYSTKVIVPSVLVVVEVTLAGVIVIDGCRVVEGWVTVAGSSVVVETYVLMDVESGRVRQRNLRQVKVRTHTNDRYQSRLYSY